MEIEFDIYRDRYGLTRGAKSRSHLDLEIGLRVRVRVRVGVKGSP